MPMRDIDMIVVHCSGSRCDFTTVFRASGPSWGIAICPAFRRPVRVLMPRSSSTSWMLPDSLPLRGFFKSRIPPILFNKSGRIQSGCALFNCRHISFTQHSTLTIHHPFPCWSYFYLESITHNLPFIIVGDYHGSFQRIQTMQGY